MAYSSKRATSGPSNEVQKLQDDITHEVNTDAQHLATSVFGNKAEMPDIKRVDDNMLNERYRQAYETQDRKYLLGEAQRDPEQFVTVARRIGVKLPEELGQTGLPEPPPPVPSQPVPPLATPMPPAMPTPVPLPPVGSLPIASPPPPPIQPGVVGPPAPMV